MAHVVCVLGKLAGKNVVAHEWKVAHEKRFRDISYLAWPINSKAQREVFYLISDALDNASNVVLVHCRHGKDRSCFAVDAFLRLMHEMDHENALWYVQMRVNNRGYPLFNLARQK